MLSSGKLKFSLQQIFYIVFATIGILVGLYYGANLVVPLIVASFIAVLFLKPINKLIEKGLPEWLSITISVAVFLFLSVLLFMLVFWQFNVIYQDLPEIKAKSVATFAAIVEWSEQKFGYNIFQYLAEDEGLLLKTFKSYIGIWASSFANLLVQITMILIYVIFILIQRKTLKKFIFKSFPENKKDTVSAIITASKKSITNYILGKGIIILILSTVYYIGFLIGKVPHALFLAMFASFFSIIPYIGNIIGGGVAVGLAILYSGIGGGLFVVAVISVSQVVENYVLTPLVIGDQIDLNPFITVFGVVAFSFLWGIVGTIIALPVLGILKVIFSHIEGMENFAILLGQEKTEKEKIYP